MNSGGGEGEEDEKERCNGRVSLPVLTGPRSIRSAPAPRATTACCRSFAHHLTSNKLYPRDHLKSPYHANYAMRRHSQEHTVGTESPLGHPHAL